MVRVMKIALGTWGRWGLGATVAAAASIAPIEEAVACTVPACDAPVRLEAMEDVPGNLVYFEITTDTPRGLALRTEAGEPIPASIRTIGNDQVFAPDAPIAPYTSVVLEYEEVCLGGSTPERREFAFRTAEHVPVTLQPGRLFVREYGVESPGRSYSEHSFVRVQLEANANYAAHHLMTSTLTIDGQPWSPWPLVGLNWRVSIDTFCPPGGGSTEIEYDSCGGIGSVPPGAHTLELRSHILGHDTPEPLSLEIVTTCPDPSNDPDVATREVRDAACALHGGRVASGAGGSAWLLVGALAMVLRRRR